MSLLEKFLEALERNSVKYIVTSDPEGEAKRYGRFFEGGVREERSIISYAESAAADTGIIFFSGEDLRASSALAEVHVAIVKKDSITPDTLSAFRLAIEKSGGRDVFSTSNASNSADIEGKRVWGMHGPKEFLVVVGT